MSSLHDIQNRFDLHIQTLDELIEFDRLILDLCITHIETLNTKLKSGPFHINNPGYLAEYALSAIRNVRENNSLRAKYQSVFNSCLVLQVAYFTSIIHDIFFYTVNRLITTNRLQYTQEELKKRNDINFQNMGSTIRTYKKYLLLEIVEDTVTNSIAVAQFCRHTIVHSLSIADQKFIENVYPLVPRDIKRNVALNEKIQFSTTELTFVKTAMKIFVTGLCERIYEQYNIY